MANNKTSFWNHEYRHQMRGLKPSIQQKIMDAFIWWDLPLNGKSDMHLQIIQEFIGDYLIKGETIQDMETRLASNYIIQ